MDQLKDIHRSIANKTLDNSEYEGKFRTDNSIYVMDNMTGEIAHTPPDVAEIEGLLNGVCDFANESTSVCFGKKVLTKKNFRVYFLRLVQLC